MQNSNSAQLIHRIETLENEKMPSWVVISEVLTGLEVISGADQNGEPWLRRITKELQKKNIKIGPNQIRKMQRAYKFVSDLMVQKQITFAWEALPKEGFSTIEVISRIYTLDPARALEAINELTTHSISYVKILERYNACREANSKNLDSKKETIFLGEVWSRHITNIVQANQNAFFGLGQKIVKTERERRSSNRFGATADVMIEVISSSRPQNSEVHGFECIIFVSDIEFRSWPRYRIKVAFHSTFFQRYWIMVVADRASAETIRKEVLILDLKNIGLAIMQEIDGQPQFEILLTPSESPIPDRTSLLYTA